MKIGDKVKVYTSPVEYFFDKELIGEEGTIVSIDILDGTCDIEFIDSYRQWIPMKCLEPPKSPKSL